MGTGYSYSAGERTARASSVAAASETGVSRSSRAMTAAPAASDLSGYSGFYGRQLAQHSNTSAASSATSSVAKSVSKSVTTAVTEKSSKKVDFMKEHSQSLEYGKSSRSQALRRAEMHAEKSGRDPRHTLVPRDLEDDICKKVADIHMYEDSARSSQHARLKVEKMEKELNALISSSMAYKSVYKKTAKQMAMEAMEACESEAASSKKIRKTVVESSSKRAAVA